MGDSKMGPCFWPIGAGADIVRAVRAGMSINDIREANGSGPIEKLRALGRPITARELGELLGVSKETILRKVKRGVYPSYREGNKILFNPLALVRHFESKGKR